MTAIAQLIRECYTTEIAEKLGHNRLNERARIEAALKATDEEEARAARLFAAGKITEAVWDSLWAEWQDRRRTLQIKLEALQKKREYHIANLDAALTIIAKWVYCIGSWSAVIKKRFTAPDGRAGCGQPGGQDHTAGVTSPVLVPAACDRTGTEQRRRCSGGKTKCQRYGSVYAPQGWHMFGLRPIW